MGKPELREKIFQKFNDKQVKLKDIVVLEDIATSDEIDPRWFGYTPAETRAAGPFFLNIYDPIHDPNHRDSGGGYKMIVLESIGRVEAYIGRVDKKQLVMSNCDAGVHVVIFPKLGQIYDDETRIGSLIALRREGPVLYKGLCVNDRNLSSVPVVLRRYDHSKDPLDPLNMFYGDIKYRNRIAFKK
jgi:hypothetical protein